MISPRVAMNILKIKLENTLRLDIKIRSGERSGKFSIKSAYRTIKAGTVHCLGVNLSNYRSSSSMEENMECKNPQQSKDFCLANIFGCLIDAEQFKEKKGPS